MKFSKLSGRVRLGLAGMFAALCLLFTGCDRNVPPAPPPTATNSFAARGVIREFPTDGGSVVIRHEEIPGYMPKMTMTLTVRDTNELRGLKEGDEVTFQLHAMEDDHWIDGLKRIGHAELPTPTSVVGGAVKELRPGELLPDFALLAEDGASVPLSSFRGRAVAFTFIFTRCPLPDFCPRMSKHFARARTLLLGRTNGPANWQLLSLSFDPEFDSPAVLRRYAKTHRQGNDDRWLFGVLATNVITSLAPQLDLKLVREGGSISHNLRTVVVDPQGRIHRQFDGNDWTPEQLADAVTEAATKP